MLHSTFQLITALIVTPVYPSACPYVQKGWSNDLLPNEIRDELGNLVKKGFTASAILEEAIMKPSRVKESKKDTPTKDTSQDKT